MKELYAAMAKAFPKLEAAVKGTANGAFKGSKYADLNAVMEAIKPALAEQELFFWQIAHENENGAMVETILAHSSGQEKSLGTVFVPASKRDAHGFGSATTYARRYGLQTAFGIPAEDDDGNAAVKSTTDTQTIPKLSQDQLAELQALVNQTATDAALFCAYYKIEALPELPASRFAHAKAALLKKIKPEQEAA